jgi:two-component system cell cycle sensor histidine kinase/response regulator CckA
LNYISYRDRERAKIDFERALILAGGVAHDLNNILSGIVSYPELLLMDLPEDNPMHQALTTIKKSGENAAAIVQDLLTLAGRGVNAQELLNLNKIIAQCLDSPEIRALGRLHTDRDLAAVLQSDLLGIYGFSIYIYKSLVNLIFNAAEAMPQGGRVEIATANHYADKTVSGFDTVGEGEYVVLSVTDSGVGIASGYSESERMGKAKELGVRGYIKKPYTLMTIAKVVQEELQRSP